MTAIPTKRFVLDSTRSCNIKCKFCYYLHTYDEWKNYDWSFDKIKQEIDKGISRSNTYMDITGGEPTISKHICESVEYALSKGVKACIITNGLVSEKRTNELLDSGLDEFLISRHGLNKTHDFITNCEGAYDRQERFIKQIKNRISFRFNCVINHYNEGEIFDIAVELAEHQPSIVNFINMNPHHEWVDKKIETQKVAANLDIVEPLLNRAVQYLENNGIGVNIRYYPMCRIKEEYRRCVCNDLHVVFDPYEWDYNILPKTFEAFRQWGERTSNNIEFKNSPCRECDLLEICGGINKAFYLATQGEYLKPIFNSDIDKNDFYIYRKNNVKTLVER